MAKNRLNKELDFLESILKQWMTVPENNGLNTSRKVYQFVCVLLSLLVLMVRLGFDCISSWSTPIF